MIQKTRFISRQCTLPDEEDHHMVKARVITRHNPDMSEEIIAKLFCDRPKSVGPYSADAVCDELTEWKLPFGSNSRKGRCPICEEKGLY